MGVHPVPIPPNEGHGMQSRPLLYPSVQLIMMDRPRSARGRKEIGVIGQASWLSSIINLVNTSTHSTYSRDIPPLMIRQLLEPVS